MKISHIKLHDFMGITDLEVSPGQFNVITGSNGVNKSSFLEALKCIVQGGHDATLLRAGSERGEVGLVLDDGVKIDKVIRPESTDIKLTPAGTRQPIRQPMTAIRSIADGIGVNPILFMQAKKADRAQVLLESMPIVADITRLQSIATIPMQKYKEGTHGLTIIGEVRQSVFDTRQGDHREELSKRHTIDQLTQAMPQLPEGVDNDTQTEDSLRAEVESNNAAMHAKLEEIRGKLENYNKQRDAGRQMLVDSFNSELAEFNRKIAELKTKHYKELMEIDERSNGVAHRADEARQTARSNCSALNSAIQPKIDSLKTNRENVAKRNQAVEMIRQLTAEAEVLKQKCDGHTLAIEQIDQYKAELLASLPIPNLEVRDGEIYRGGVVYERLNTAQRIQIAIDLARIRSKELGIVCVDGLESFDADTFAAFEQQATQETKLQWFVTKVDKGPLTVNTGAGK